MTLRVQVSQQTAVELNVEPINQWGDVRRIDTPSRFTTARSRSTSATWCSLLKNWRWSKASIAKSSASRSQTATSTVRYSCAAARGPSQPVPAAAAEPQAGLNHVAFTVRDIHEVIGGGIAMNKNAWSTFIGPGRHPVSSAYFWYVNSPTGGAFEYYTNDDYLTENWRRASWSTRWSPLPNGQWRAVSTTIPPPAKKRRRYDGADCDCRRAARRAAGGETLCATRI